MAQMKTASQLGYRVQLLVEEALQEWPNTILSRIQIAKLAETAIKAGPFEILTVEMLCRDCGAGFFGPSFGLTARGEVNYGVCPACAKTHDASVVKFSRSYQVVRAEPQPTDLELPEKPGEVDLL